MGLNPIVTVYRCGKCSSVDVLTLRWNDLGWFELWRPILVDRPRPPDPDRSAFQEAEIDRLLGDSTGEEFSERWAALPGNLLHQGSPREWSLRILISKLADLEPDGATPQPFTTCMCRRCGKRFLIDLSQLQFAARQYDELRLKGRSRSTGKVINLRGPRRKR